MPSPPLTRCPWAGDDPLNRQYHDEEWGVPLHDERGLFEFLILEGAQAGLSWITILRKRDAYRAAFADFDAAAIAAFGARDVKRLLGDAGIVRNRLKISAAIDNARAYLQTREELGSFDRYLWSFVDGRPVVQPFQARRGRPGRDRCLARHEPRPQTARLPLRRPDHLLRPHAGHRHGQRPPGRLLPPPPDPRPLAAP